MPNLFQDKPNNKDRKNEYFFFLGLIFANANVGNQIIVTSHSHHDFHVKL